MIFWSKTKRENYDQKLSKTGEHKYMKKKFKDHRKRKNGFKVAKLQEEKNTGHKKGRREDDGIR